MSDPSRAWSVRAPLLIGSLALAILIAGFGVWSVTSQLAGAVVASGRIEVERNRQAIQHPDGGRVAEVMVGEGDRIMAGDIVLRLEPGLLTRDLAVARGQFFEVRVRRARLEAERDGAAEIAFPADVIAEAAIDADLADLLAGQTNLFEARAESLSAEAARLEGRVTQIEAQIDALEAQERALTEQLELVEADLARQQDLLDRGLIQVDPILRLRRDAAQLRGSLGELEARKAEAAERVIETELTILQLFSMRREEAIAELREIRVNEEELRQRVADLERRFADLDLRAPVAGRIIGLAVFGPQAVVRAADPVAFLVPEGRPLIITARVPAISVDEVFVGQVVTLRFPAFDLRNIPDLTGTVAQVSADAFTDEATGVSFYRAEIVLGEGQIALLGDRQLVPGMPVEAFIRTQDRTPLAYLVEPLRVYFARAFRES
ncbi:HlyD family type I secretion periplasmic adaptor subunit [Roseicyclus mahoneyensis]|uniref:Membrane fusion protein (MFP) family protein n=1 Tax=Roseicyclus mahoneyensis TaxID=164332 RepID=A0A316GFK0_9RHOB|nr:HlyD family type I secretion periplasmic adaptor subunit [Roseicyclus mahoneyensis]PWK59767.1 HlyD family secretion protein [Roseicyclus mahoneyensis]